MASLALPMTAAPWHEVNDGVMGGMSTSRMQEEKGVLVFSGTLSLENNGGFASARRAVRAVPSEIYCVRLEARGDGRRYQFRIRQDDGFDGIAWSHLFGSAERWQTIELSLSEFVPVYRGRRVANAGPVVPREIRQIGLMLADKSPGPFRLEVRSIEFLEKGQGGDERH